MNATLQWQGYNSKNVPICITLFQFCVILEEFIMFIIFLPLLRFLFLFLFTSIVYEMQKQHLCNEQIYTTLKL